MALRSMGHVCYGWMRSVRFTPWRIRVLDWSDAEVMTIGWAELTRPLLVALHHFLYPTK